MNNTAHSQENTDQSNFFPGLHVLSIKNEDLPAAIMTVKSNIDENHAGIIEHSDKLKIQRNLEILHYARGESWIIGKGQAVIDEEIVGKGCAGLIVSDEEKNFLKSVPGTFRPAESECSRLIHF